MTFEKTPCSSCGQKFPHDNIKVFDGEWYCDSCFDEHFTACDYCEQVFPRDEITFWEGEYFCSDCLSENSGVCDNCGERIYDRYAVFVGDRTYCEPCASEVSNEQSEVKTITIPFKAVKSKGYKINPYKNLCGVEIECLNNDIEEQRFTCSELEKYQFSQIPDGSLDDGGAEFVSNAFNGDALLSKLKAFCQELGNRDYYVSRSCGLHIHIKISKRLEFIKKVFAFYSLFEEMFFRMLPESRQRNSYCCKFSQTYSNIGLENIRNCRKAIDLQKLLYDSRSPATIKKYKQEKYNGKRYNWINFHSLFYRGTLEIRNHSGTISYTKIKNWLLIHLRVLDFIRHLPFETICQLPQTDAFFLSLFDEDMKKYITSRWIDFGHPSVEAGC